MYASSSKDNGSQHLDANLFKAATKGNFEMFKNYAPPLDHLILGKNQNTILHVHLNSPCERSKEFVEKVLGKCPQLLWQTNNNGDIPLHIAAKYGHLDIVNVFIEETKKRIHRDLEIGEEEADSTRRMLRKTNKQKETALHLAIRGKFSNVVQAILEHEDPNFMYTANVSGESPLYLAVDKLHYGIAIEILNKFESPDCGGPNGRTAFHAAACSICYGSKFLSTATAFKFLSNATAFSFPSFKSHLITIFCGLTPALLELMLSKLCSFVNQEDESGWTPLHYAAYLNNFELVKKILGKDKGSAYATDKERNRTALHMASCRGNIHIMQEIIDNCPQCCEIRDFRDWNVLHYAVISKSEEAVKTIMKDPSLVYLVNERDIKGYTPMRLLLVSNHSSSLISWIHNKSAVPLNFWKDELIPIFMNTFLVDYEDRDHDEVLQWMKDLGFGPLGIKIAGKHYDERENEIKEKVIPELEKAKDSHVVAAALVATVTFAAAFTLPGGYIGDEKYPNLKGTPILSRNAAFNAFVVTDAIAMVLSTSSVFIHFIMVMLGYKQRYYWLIRSAFWFVVLAMGAMVVAFVTGTYAVLAPPSKGLAIASCLIGLTFFLHAAYATIRLIFNFIKRDRVENRASSTTESLGRLLESAPQYLSCGCNWYYWTWFSK